VVWEAGTQAESNPCRTQSETNTGDLTERTSPAGSQAHANHRKKPMATSNHRPAEFNEFIKTFNGIARHRHRYTVFQDFVTLSAITLHNAIHKNETLEAEYMQTVGRYTRDEMQDMCKLLALTIDLLDPEPRDVLGPLFMDLNLGSEAIGQFFTPPEVSKLMAMIIHGEELESLQKPFVTFAEPACGAGGMVLAFVDIMIAKKLNPAERLWVQCQDIDRTAALMCYIQLTLWNVPGVVIVGDTIAAETREVFYTPAHCLGLWGYKLRRHWEEGNTLSPLEASADPQHPAEPADDTAAAEPICTSPTPSPAHEVAIGQLRFDFTL
jgi:hypothetical protein